MSGPPARPAALVGGVVAVMLSYLLILPLVLQLLATIAYLFRGRPGEFNTYLNDALDFVYPEGILVSHVAIAAFIPIAFLLTRYLNQRDPVYLTSVQPGMRWRFLLLVGGFSVLVFCGVLAIGGQGSWDPEHNWGWWLAIVLITTPFQAAGEEYLFRGYLMQVVGSLVNQKWLVILITALAFGGIHGWGQGIEIFVDRFVFAALMGVLAIFTGGLEASIAAHTANNLLAFGFYILTGQLSEIRAANQSTWGSTATNMIAYLVIAVVAWTIGRRLNVATTTPEK